MTPYPNGRTTAHAGKEDSMATSEHPLRGAFTALVTPFTADGAVDERRFRDFVEWQILAGIDGIVPCGTTGESPTLSHEEKEAVIGWAVEVARAHSAGRHIPVIAGTGTNDTKATIAATRRAAAAGADAALVVTPYYNKPDQRMLEAHYRAIADEGGLPVVVYNVPSRTGVNVEAATMLRLADHPRIVAVKEASANLDQIQTIIRNRPAGFSVLAGDDSWTLTVMAHGGEGVISVASNEIPGVMARLCGAARSGDWEEARRLHERWLPLMRANFLTVNPVPVKSALAAMGLIEDVVRQPLLPLVDPLRAQLMDILREGGLVAPVAGVAR
jgi:4-hydroxy-tetrahydrodipicolinate synthase